MNVQIHSIEPANEGAIFNVVVLIGTDQHKLAMTVETDTIANQEIQVIQGDEQFCRLFKFDRKAAQELYKLVSKIHNRQIVELPVELGDLYTGKLESASIQQVK